MINFISQAPLREIGSVFITETVDDRDGATLLAQLTQMLCDFVGPAFNNDIRCEPDGSFRLPGKQVNQIGVRHRRQRMIPHGRIRKQPLFHKMVTAIGRATVYGKRGEGNCERLA